MASAVAEHAVVCTLLAAAQLVHDAQGAVPTADHVEPATQAAGGETTQALPAEFSW